MRLLLLLLFTSQNSARLNQQHEMNARRGLLFGHQHKSRYRNWLKTPGVGGKVDTIVRPVNTVGGFIQTTEFQSGLDALKAIVAENTGRRVRAYGSRWSSNNMPYTDEVAVESWGLNYVRIGIDEPSHLTAGYSSKGNLLAFSQCGVILKLFNQALLEKGLALPTTGETDGQRMVGLTATGAHGANTVFGALERAVKGLHIVIPGEVVYIQSASDPVVTQEYVDSIGGGRLINDDDMLAAALIHVGSFGIVHGLLLEAEPLYKIERQVKKFNFQSVKDVVYTLNDIASLGFEGVDSLPFHFEFSVNPYIANDENQESAWFLIYQKRLLTDEDIDQAIGRGLDKPITSGPLIQFLMKKWNPLWLLAVTPGLKRFVYGLGLNVALDTFYDINNPGPTTAFPTEFFTDDFSDENLEKSPFPSSIGSEIAVPFEDLEEALTTIIEVMLEDPIPCPISARFLKPSDATLSFTKFGSFNVAMELSCSPYGSLFFRRNEVVFEKIHEALEAKRETIQHSYHWGQWLPKNDVWVRNTYGTSLDEWKAQREALLDDEGRTMFSNDLLEALGMNS